MTNAEFSKCECRHCAGHIEYPVESGGQRIACPHCGQAVDLPDLRASALTRSRRLPVWVSIFLWMLIIAAAIGLFVMKRHYPGNVVAGSVVQKAPEKSVAKVVASPAETITNNFAVSAFKLEKTAGSSLIHLTGTVRNLADKQRFGVKVEFSLFDANGAAVGKASDYTGTLAAGGVWKFKALVMGGKVVEAKLDAVREDQ